MRKNKKYIILSGIIVVVIFISVVKWRNEKTKETAIQVPKYVFTYAENQEEGYPTTEAALYFSKIVFQRSKGSIKINVHSGGKLADEVSALEQLQYGGLDFARVSVMTAGEYIPEVNVLQLPYLYEDSEHMWEVLDGKIGRGLMSKINQYGVVGLSWYDAGTRNFYTKERVSSLEDLQGLKIRVAQSEFMKELVSALGATPIEMDYAKVYSALELGLIDGAENNWPSYESMEHHKVAKYMLIDEHNQIPELQLVSSVTWNKLNEEEKELLSECALESSIFERGLWREYMNEIKEEAIKEGVIVTEMEKEEKVKFKEAVMAVYEDLSDEYTEVINSIIKVGNEYKNY